MELRQTHPAQLPGPPPALDRMVSTLKRLIQEQDQVTRGDLSRAGFTNTEIDLLSDIALDRAQRQVHLDADRRGETP